MIQSESASSYSRGSKYRLAPARKRVECCVFEQQTPRRDRWRPQRQRRTRFSLLPPHSTSRENLESTMGSAEWPSLPMSRKAARTENKIRAVVERVLAGARPEINLSMGDPTAYGITECPAVVAEAVSEAVSRKKHDGYAASAGAPAARAAVGESVEPPVGPEDVFVCSGASGALEMALAVLLDGDGGVFPRGHVWPGQAAKTESARFLVPGMRAAYSPGSVWHC